MRALAVVRPAGKTAQRSICGNVQPCSTILTVPIFDFGREHPFRSDRDTGVGEYSGTYSLGSTHTQATLQRDRNVRVVVLEGPVLTAGSLIINHGVVRSEIAGRRGFTGPREIGRGTNNDLGSARDPSRSQLESASRPIRKATSIRS